MLGICLENVRKNAPLVHCITNYVTVNDVANVLLAVGASPIMADEPEEAADITAICSGLNINMGTLNTRTIASMIAAGRRAQELGHVLLLDPVGAGASRLRTETAGRLMEELHFDVIRGNSSEIKCISQVGSRSRGVDANAEDAVTEQNLPLSISFVKETARKQGCIIVLTGAIDLVTDGEKCYVIRNGRPEMSRITGTGCQLSALLTAFLAANPEHKLEAAAAAVICMGLAGELAWECMAAGDGNAAYRNRIIDTIYNMTGTILEQGANYEIK